MSSVSDEDRTVLNEICSDLGKIQKLLTAINNDKNKLSHTLECNKVEKNNAGSDYNTALAPYTNQVSRLSRFLVCLLSDQCIMHN